MPKSEREQHRERLLEIMEDNDLTKADVAELLHVSTDTVNSWCKPETTKSSNPVPLWALELLTYKMEELNGGNR